MPVHDQLSSIDFVRPDEHVTVAHEYSYTFFHLPKVLRLRDYEVVRYDKSLCGEYISVRPYGEVGPVKIGTYCCLVCVDSKIGTLLQSYGCDRKSANYIVNALNEKIASRGEAAVTRAIEQAGKQADEILVKTELISRMLCIPFNTSAQHINDR